MVEPERVVSHAVSRDVTDTKFLDLAVASDADYFVTNDRRHLLPLKRIGRTRIVTPHKFLALRAAR
jgi:predicted nucleic acid-binding protein